MNRILLSIICCLLSSYLTAQTPNEQKIIQKMAAAASEIKTVQCDFTQTKHTKLLKKEQVSKGRMSCQLPDKLRWEYTSPRAASAPSPAPPRGSDRPRSLPSGRFRGGYGATSLIMNCVTGKCLTDSSAFHVTAEEMPTKYVATLIPQRKEMKRMFTKLVLHFDTSQSTVTEVELHEKNGDRTIIELHDIRINE